MLASADRNAMFASFGRAFFWSPPDFRLSGYVLYQFRFRSCLDLLCTVLYSTPVHCTSTQAQNYCNLVLCTLYRTSKLILRKLCAHACVPAICGRFERANQKFADIQWMATGENSIDKIRCPCPGNVPCEGLILYSIYCQYDGSFKFPRFLPERQ